jgi:drug/metabolite transporter (DMT)-like permease
VGIAVATLVCALVFTLAGVHAREAVLIRRGAPMAAVLLAIVLTVFTARSHDPGVSTNDYVVGLALTFALTGLAAMGYYALGRGLARHPIALTLAFLVTVPMLFVAGFISLIVIVDLVHCPPDAYECPL